MGMAVSYIYGNRFRFIRAENLPVGEFRDGIFLFLYGNLC